MKPERAFDILNARCSVSIEHIKGHGKSMTLLHGPAVKSTGFVANPRGGDYQKMSGDKTFGAFIRKRRLALDPHISLRKMAQLLSLSPVYMSNIETGREAAPKKEVLDNLAGILRLTKQETELMYDLAAESKNYTAVPGDLPEYITTHEYAKIALRVAKDVDATDAEWIEFIDKLKKRAREEKSE